MQIIVKEKNKKTILKLFSCTIMFDALCNIAWEWFWLYRVGKTAYYFFYFPLKKNINVNKKSNVLLGAVGKAKTTGAVGVRGERKGFLSDWM
jgi:hypothetical protein